MFPGFAAKLKLFAATFACVAALAASGAAQDRPRQDPDAPRTIDWGAIPHRAVMLFYPGQSSYQWLRGEGHGPGAAAVRGGVACAACHAGQEAALGGRISAGGALEPTPIAGKPGTIELHVQAAHDAERLYMRMQWKTQADRPGDVHELLRYNGQRWEVFGGPRSKAEVRSGTMPPFYEDRLAIMLDDGKVPQFAQQGCWLACHTGQRDMPGQPTAQQVRAHPVIGQLLGQSDVRKYLPDSREAGSAAWDATRSPADIARLKEAGVFLDLMQWRGARSNPIGMGDDGYVLEYRLSDAGAGPFASNVDRATQAPRFMFDPARTGFRALSLDQAQARSKPNALIREENAVPYDPGHAWQVGDLLPSRVLSRADARGSAADLRHVVGQWEAGTWTVIWVQPLNTGHPADDKRLRPGGRYTVSFSVHDDSVTTRFHHVSFPLTLGLGVEGDIAAVKLE